MVAPGAKRQTTFDTSKADHQLLAALFDAEMLGVAIFDAQHHFIAVNKTLASLHGISAKDHVGMTLREVLPQVPPKAESLINQVLHTGKPILNVPITSQMPTRNEPGHWIVSFVPIKDEKQQVSQVATIAVESTQQVKLAECLRRLMDRLPQVRDRVSWAYLSSSQKQTVDPSLLAQSAEGLEQCVRAMQQLSGLVEAIAPSSSGKDEDSRQSLLPYVAPTAPPENRGQTTEIGLAPREVEVVTLLAASKSNKEVSNILGITVKTVETYRRRIMSKLQIHSMSELVRYAVRNKLIRP